MMLYIAGSFENSVPHYDKDLNRKSCIIDLHHLTRKIYPFKTLSPPPTPVHPFAVTAFRKS